MGSAVVNGKIHLIGGTKNIREGTAMNHHEVYDPAKNTWETRAPLPTASEHVYAGVLKGRIHVVGGRNHFSNMNLNQIYNPATNTWSAGAPMNDARSGFGLAVFEKRIYVFGGEAILERNVLNSVERYDPDLNRWERLNPMPYAVHGNPAAVADRFIYVLGGAEISASGTGSNYVQRLDISNSPKQPKNLTAQTTSSTSIRLTWQDLSSNEANYVVQRKTIGAFQTIATLPANAKQYNAKGLISSTKYSFRVLAQNGCGRSAPSNIATTTTRQ
jgi:hypothetical protein